MPRVPSPRSLLLLMVFLLAAPAAYGAPPELLRAPTADAAPSGTPATVGLRVFLDPVTGEVVSRPSGEQVRRLQQSIEELEVFEPVPDLHPFYLYPGGTGIYVGDRFMTSTVVRRSPDGSLVIDCTTDPDHEHHPHETDRRPGAPVM